LQDEVLFHGHPNVRSLHSRTLEITTEENLTLRGDCIIGVRANKACRDIGDSIRNRLSKDDSVVILQVCVGSEECTIKGKGEPTLTLQHSHDIVVRKSRFTCPRTLSVSCDKASIDIPRNMVEMLQNPENKGIFRITVE